jgi:hypothetical protein
MTFSSLFLESLEHHRVIIMEIYRLLNLLLENDPTSKDNQSIDDQKGILIYYPPYNYQLNSSDMKSNLFFLFYVSGLYNARFTF